MPLTSKKSKRTKFGLFASQAEAIQVCEEKAKFYKNSKFFTTQVKRNKEGKNTWLAYCLTPKNSPSSS